MNYERRYDIDWLRVTAIGLLLIYHIAIIFQPWALFIGFIQSKESIITLWKPMSLLNVWRIPLLFFVSGMGVYFAMRKRSIKGLLLERSKRILVPYLFGIIAIVPIQSFLFQQHYGLQLSFFFHPFHLWFLGNLLIYVSLFFPLFDYILKNKDGKWKAIIDRIVGHPLGVLTVTFFFVAEVWIVNPQEFTVYAQTLHGYAIGFLAFFFGFLFMYVGVPFWNMSRKWFGLYLVTGAAFFCYRVLVLEGSAPHYLLAIESNFWILGIFGFGYRYLNRPSKALFYLSKAAYPAYILHMIGLNLGAYMILPLDLSIWSKFVFIVLFTGVFCIGTYELLIRRIPIVGIFFGLGDRKKVNQKTSQVLQPVPQTK